MRILILVLSSLSLFGCNAELEGFLVSTRREWVRYESARVSILNFFNTSRHSGFDVKLDLSSYDDPLVNYYHLDGQLTDSDVVYSIDFPDDADGTLVLKVDIRSVDGSYKFDKNLSINVVAPKNFVFIQTDKPFYKPSDTVKVRLLVATGRDLKPLDGQVSKAYITDAQQTVVAQWINQTSRYGIYDFELPLSSEPRLGEWNFVAETSSGKKKKKFEIQRYVLPKFSVTVQSDPEYLTGFGYSNVSVKACARYTYDRPVAGDVYFKDGRGDEVVYELGDDGCRTARPFGNISNSYLYNLDVSVTVTEKGTGISRAVLHEIPIHRHVSVKVSPICSDNIKPWIGYKCFFRAFYGGRVPAKNVELQVHERHRGRLFDATSDDDGFFLVSIPASPSEISTYYSIYVKPTGVFFSDYNPGDLFLKRWMSPSSTYLGIANNVDRDGFVAVDPFNLTLLLVTRVPVSPSEIVTLRYMVYSGGDLWKVGNFSLNLEDWDHTNDSEETNFHRYRHSRDVDLSGVSGMLRLVVYFRKEDGGEVVSDAIKFRVQYRSAQASMEFASSRLQPGLQTTLKIRSPGKSLCSVGVYDKSLEILSPVEHLTHKEVEDHLENRKPRKFRVEERVCEPDDPLNALAPTWDTQGRPTFAGSRDVFQNEDQAVLSDFEISQYFCKPYELEQEILRAPIALSNSRSVFSFPQEPVHRHFFPESWIWNLFEVEGNAEVPLMLPHSITEWTGSGFCVGEHSGLAISQKFSIVGFQPFFINLHLPYSIVRGERAVVPLSIHSYLEFCIKVELNISHTPHLDVTELQSNEIILCNEELKVINLTVVAKKLGRVNLTIEAKSTSIAPLDTNYLFEEEEINVQDSVTFPILVKSPGKPQEISHSAFVCAPATGEIHHEVPKQNVVKESVKSFISVSGDLMASAMANMEDLLALPTGCGEQNMVKFAPNIYILDYLKQSRLLSEDVKEKAIEYLKVGYQRELQYRRRDGSYSAFGQSDPEGSLWLTAFVVKSFAGAAEHIHIDQSDLDQSIKFIQRVQSDDGCFPLVGRLLQGGLMGHPGSDATPTPSYNSYIISSLVEAGLPKNDTAIQKGYECLKKSLDDSNTLYDEILLLYAHSLVVDVDPSHLEVFDRLLERVTRKSVAGEGVHWTMGTHNAAADVEMTSYVMLALLRSGRFETNEMLKMAKWLTSKRNLNGGFYSTQDTVLALNALSSLAVHVANPENATVVVTNYKKLPAFVVNPTNKLLLQMVEDVALQQKNVKYSVTGSGCVLIQVATSFNRLAFDGDQHSISAFNLSTGVKNSPTSCKEKLLHICFVYNGEGERTDMAILAVDLPTGWIADRESVDEVYHVIPLKRHEFEEGAIKFYFDEVTKLETCLHFKVYQDIVVQQRKPARVEIYDYYNIEMSADTAYVIRNGCPRASKKEEELPPLDPA